MKLSDQLGMGYLWNKDQVRDASGRRDSKLRKNVLNNLNDAQAQIGPICLEEKSMITIRSWGLYFLGGGGGELPKDSKNFIRLGNP